MQKLNLTRVLVPAMVLALSIGCTSPESSGSDTAGSNGNDSGTDEPQDTTGSDSGGTSSTTDGTVSDRTDEVYERTKLLEVRIELSEADWAALRGQNRTGADLGITADCMPPNHPFDSPFTWFSSRVTVDGEVIENVGIRKKGFIGSLSREKPSFKVRFDKFVEGQTYLDAKRLTLNNAIQDASYVRQCLAYDLFRAVGTAAPRCNFAHVFINGVDLGVYTNIESIKKPFLRQNFADPEGNLYEGTLSDFREGWSGTFNQKTNESTPDTRAIDVISEILQGPDEGLIEALSEHIDMDAFLSFWAVETLTAHWDGYAGNTNNYHLYEDPTSGLLYFIPWGVDQTFGISLMLFEGILAPRSINTAGLLTRRLYLHPEGQTMYIDRLLSVMDAYWDVDAMKASIETMTGVFEDSLLSPDIQGEAGSYIEALDYTIGFVTEQPDVIHAELEDGPQAWEHPLRESLCDGESGSGTEWNGNLNSATGEGELEYIRPESDGAPGCEIRASLTGIASIDLCGESCTFAMEMTPTDVVVSNEENSGCSAEELAGTSDTIMLGQSTIQVAEYEGNPVFALMGADGETGNWTPVPNGYSLSFGGGESIVWYFGAEL